MLDKSLIFKPLKASFLTALMGLVWLGSAHSQEVIVSQGESHNDGVCIIEWSLGEPVSETMMDADGLFSQGFHQPSYLPPPQIPTVSEWGLIFMLLLLLSIGLIGVLRMKNSLNMPSA